jgi:hypothetical protein
VARDVVGGILSSKQQESERKELVRELQHLRELKAIEDDRKDLVRELQRLRERSAALEGKQAGARP